MVDRSLEDNHPFRVRREKRWPITLDTRDPEGVAAFTLGLGYAPEDVVNTLVKRCNVDRSTATRIVNEIRNQQEVT